MNNKICKNCRAYAFGGAENKGQCHLLSPRVNSVSGGRGMFPIVMMTDWCTKFVHQLTTLRDEDYVRNHVLQCRVGKVEIIPGLDLIRFHLADGNCADMDGAVDVAQQLHPLVKRIETYSGDKPDTFYITDSSGEWIAVDGAR